MVGAITGQVTTRPEHTERHFWHSTHIGHRYSRSQGVQTRPYRTILHQVQTGHTGYRADSRLTPVCMVTSNYQKIFVISRPGDTNSGHVRGRWWCYTRAPERDPSTGQRGRAESRTEERRDDSSTGTRIVHSGTAVQRWGNEEQRQCGYGY